ncbi:MAG: FAD-dependent oxidoreductase [Afipia sp.]|nr:FAD-dependent oxidoreductase [Afipia sp.]
MRLTRRDFVAGSAALAALSPRRLSAAALPREVEIAVIGAGAAGIAAARRIAATGRSVLVLEASDRIGGRCLTDNSTFDTPFDRGARWLYNADSSPIARLARGVELDLYPATRGQRIRIGRRNARAGEVEDFLALQVRVNRTIADAVRGKPDMSVAAVMPKDLREWDGTTDFIVGPSTTGKDTQDLSALDLGMMAQRDGAAMCRQGLGTLVAKLGASLTVALSTPVSRISWSTKDAQLETPSGTLTAKAVVVTASANALLSGKMRFSPDLPKRQQDAASKLSLGSYDHIALELPGNPLGLAKDDVVIEQSSDKQTGLLLANLGGSSLCQVDIGGSFGAEMSSRGEAAMTAFALEWLTKLFGSDVKGTVKRTRATRWNDVPYVLGAMAAASPGGQPMHRVLMEPLGCLLFAGDAVHETLAGTVGGAWESGERAADAALRKIGALKPLPSDIPAKQPRGKTKRDTSSSVSPPAGQRGSLAWPRNN